MCGDLASIGNICPFQFGNPWLKSMLMMAFVIQFHELKHQMHATKELNDDDDDDNDNVM